MECPLNPEVRVRPLAVRSTGAGVLAALAVGTIVGASGLVIQFPSSAEAATSSAVTITAADQDADIANAPMPDLAVTISQTRDLVAQGLQITWTGGKESVLPGTDSGGENFLQIMQCWGDETVPAGQPARPDRTTCQYGAFNSPGARRDGPVNLANVAPQDSTYTVPGSGLTATYTSIPFRSVDGKVIATVVNSKRQDTAENPIDMSNNEFFTLNTSNEVKWAGSSSGGTGSTKFEVQTAQQADGLGCGQPLKAADNTVTGQSCWLVIIPRGTADKGEEHVTQPGLLWDSWKHRLAIKLDFKPLGVNCAIGAAERQLSGSELVAGAVASWQPVLCNAQGGSIYTLSTGTESDAVKAASGAAENSPLALTSRPLAGSGADPNVYAPVALTGLAITFAIDRQPKTGAATPEEYAERANETFTELKLTPRLVAKLLTNSYTDALPTGADKTHLGSANARNLTVDKDFLAINDEEWAYQSLVSPSLADLLIPQGRSDGAWQLWRYVLADADARAFLAGTPDPWGMVVNPWSSTSKTVNPSGTGLTLPRDNFPKADPAEEAAVGDLSGPVNLVTWRPYTNDFDQSAYLTLRGDGQTLGAWDINATPRKYQKAPRNLQGFQRVLGLSDAASAAKYQVVTASLLNPAGGYVLPTSEGMTAAAAAMTSTATQAGVYEYDPAGAKAKAAASAYPLTMPVYAAINPAQGDAEARASYAAFIRFAVQSGQTPGTASGQLPAGYAPLPKGWRDQALAAAAVIGAAAPSTAAQPDSSYDNSLDNGGDLADPEATGSTSDLFGAATPDDPDTGAMPAAIPASLLAGLGAAAAVPLMSRIRRP